MPRDMALRCYVLRYGAFTVATRALISTRAVPRMRHYVYETVINHTTEIEQQDCLYAFDALRAVYFTLRYYDVCLLLTHITPYVLSATPASFICCRLLIGIIRRQHRSAEFNINPRSQRHDAARLRAFRDVILFCAPCCAIRRYAGACLPRMTTCRAEIYADAMPRSACLLLRCLQTCGAQIFARVMPYGARRRALCATRIAIAAAPCCCAAALDTPMSIAPLCHRSYTECMLA